MKVGEIRYAVGNYNALRSGWKEGDLICSNDPREHIWIDRGLTLTTVYIGPTATTKLSPNIGTVFQLEDGRRCWMEFSESYVVLTRKKNPLRSVE